MPLFLFLRVFVVNYFRNFPEFFFWIEGLVGGVYHIETFFDFYISISIIRSSFGDSLS